ncbi:hypothetical protein NQ317_005900 [Molorchus minor]|uniref:NADP-dependent oxidoreductase domain-containing protein n=1 Tax=Molorchus minor TaxID=1323400 RepID=A0ABQ9J082_9CUCU|nr:hypothetical protein NQ317_005900 [Molorchus minor]
MQSTARFIQRLLHSINRNIQSNLIINSKMASNEHFELSSGFKIPAIGYGTWLADDEEKFEKAIDTALEIGYRHIDCAIAYQNEHIVGRVLKKWLSTGRLSREDLFVTAKLPPCAMRPAGVRKYLNKSLESLQLDYIDLYLVHTPFGLNEVEGNLHPTKPDGTSDYDSTTDHLAIWKGFPNFNSDQINRILKNCRIPPCNLQIEHHAYLQQPKLVEFCKLNKIIVTAYSPLGSPGLSKLGKETPDLLGHTKVKEIAKRYNKTTAQVLLRHILQKGIVAIPKSVTPERIRQNIDIFNFQLNEEDMETLNGLDENLRILDFKFIFKGLKIIPNIHLKGKNT